MKTLHTIKNRWIAYILSMVLCFTITGCDFALASTSTYIKQMNTVSLKDIPKYSEAPFVIVQDNKPNFGKIKSTKSYEYYGELDAKGRCTVAEACIGKDLMPTKKRSSIGQVKPTGWKMAKYDWVDGKYLYNRCHLIGYQLTGENANPNNLITGTRYLNVDGMLPFENMVADYIKETGNHVLYRVTPIFEGNNMVASGVQMEAKSVEDNGEGICYNVFVYNVQPGVKIYYKNGESEGLKYGNYLKDDKKTSTTKSSNSSKTTTGKKRNTSSVVTSKYIFNTNTKKFHVPSCYTIKRMSNSNKKSFSGSRQDAINQGYDPCKVCHP